MRTVADKGKLDKVVDDVKRLQIDVLGSAEVGWLGVGEHRKNGWAL